MALRKAGAVATVRAEFPGQQPDERELGPLRNAKRPEQLLLGVFYGWRDRVHSGNGQRTPRASGFSSKLLRIGPRIKLIRMRQTDVRLPRATPPITQLETVRPRTITSRPDRKRVVS